MYKGIYHGFKKIIARRVRASVTYSGKAKTLAADSKQIDKFNKEEKIEEYLIKVQIKWKFNLSRASWWGRQFERMVGLVKQSPFKATEIEHNRN